MWGSGSLPVAANRVAPVGGKGPRERTRARVQFTLQIVAPPAGLAARINTFYVIQTDEARIEEIVPAYSAQLLMVAGGSLTLAYADGSEGRAESVAINAPLLRAAPCVLEGPTTIVGASLTHLGWQALANLPADKVHDRMIPAADILAPEQAARLAEAAAACAAGRIAPRDLCAPLGEAVAAAPHALRPDHVAVVEAIIRWLGSGFDPPLEALYATVALSPRQLQRISRRYFGVAPAQVRGRFRAIRAAMLLANPALPAAFRDEMLASYFDQAHLIRDMRRYTGRTPSQLRHHALSAGLLDPSGHGDAAGFLRPAPDGAGTAS